MQTQVRFSGTTRLDKIDLFTAEVKTNSIIANHVRLYTIVLVFQCLFAIVMILDQANHHKCGMFHLN